MAHVVLLDELAVARQLLVEATERRALVAGDHRAGVEAAAAVGAVLVERQADEALEPGQEDAALLEDVLVVQRDVQKRAAPATTAVAGTTPALALLGAAAWCCTSANGDRHPSSPLPSAPNWET